MNYLGFCHNLFRKTVVRTVVSFTLNISAFLFLNTFQRCKKIVQGIADL